MQKLKDNIRDVFEKALTNVVGIHCVAGTLIWIPNELHVCLHCITSAIFIQLFKRIS